MNERLGEFWGWRASDIRLKERRHDVVLRAEDNEAAFIILLEQWAALRCSKACWHSRGKA
jgi:hypothetical protein